MVNVLAQHTEQAGFGGTVPKMDNQQNFSKSKVLAAMNDGAGKHRAMQTKSMKYLGQEYN